RQGKMVHPDVPVAALPGQGSLCIQKYADLFFRRWQPFVQDHALVLFLPGRVRVAEERDPVRPKAQHLRKRSSETIYGLMGQAVDEIVVDAVIAEPSRRFCGGLDGFDGLLPIDGLLNAFVEILYAQTQAVESGFACRL